MKRFYDSAEPKDQASPTVIAPKITIFKTEPRLDKMKFKPFDYSPLTSWLNKQCSLPEKLNVLEKDINFDVAFVALDKQYYLYEAAHIKELGRGLKTSRKETKAYLQEAGVILNEENVYKLLLDSEESEKIINKLGSPPKPCYTVYFISVKIEKDKENVVYIGINGKDTHRFDKGHRAALELHNPKYKYFEKVIYIGTVFTMNKNGDYLPIEWVKDLKKGLSLLDSIESQLIYYFQPELNTQKKNKNCASYPFNLIRIENLASDFLDQKYVGFLPLSYEGVQSGKNQVTTFVPKRQKEETTEQQNMSQEERIDSSTKVNPDVTKAPTFNL